MVKNLTLVGIVLIMVLLSVKFPSLHINLKFLQFSCCAVLGGPQVASVGCAGFAAFSVLIEKFLDRHD